MGVLLVEVGAVEVRVHLQGGHVGVALDLLQLAKVRAAREHMGGKGVAQRVRKESHPPHQASVALAYDVTTLPR